MSTATPNTLRIRRAETRATQRDAAQALGIGLTRYWEIENGYTDPTSEEQAALCAFFAVDASVLWPEGVPVTAEAQS